MRFVVVGVGAVGGVVGGRLAQSGHDVILVARGRHGRMIARSGLTIESPNGTETVTVDAVTEPAEVTFGDGDVVLLAVKSQDTDAALIQLAAAAGPTLPIVCLQNGVRNEREALRRFERVYGVPVMCPTAFLEPGQVIAYSAPTAGILDIGRYPEGVDGIAEEVATALAASGFSSHAVPDIARWKWAKLVTNLGNAIEAVCGPPARRGPIGELARAEGRAVLAAAGIDAATEAEDAERRGDHLSVQPVGGRLRPGGSTFQSLARRTGSVETDFINGEIVLLGRLYGVPTPVNEALQLEARRLAGEGAEPGVVGEADFLARLSGGG